MSKRSHSSEVKYEVIMAYKNGDYTIGELCSKYGIYSSTLYNWTEKYEKEGVRGLEESKTWRKYSKELKEAAVRDYISGEYSLREIVRKYSISGAAVLENWITKYNSHRELKATEKGRTRSMTKGRKTTWQERIEIVQDALSNDKDFQQTAGTHKVSYQQVYQWVRKYEAGGWDALKDRTFQK